MDIDEFVALTEERGRRPSERSIKSFEKKIAATLPDDYRAFLERCNGGCVGGSIWYGDIHGAGLSVGVHHVGGLRRIEEISLEANRKFYQLENRWIPADLLWVLDDPFGNATCVGIRGPHRGKVYFWDHERIPDEDVWNGQVETAGNVTLLAPSFSAFLKGCGKQL